MSSDTTDDFCYDILVCKQSHCAGGILLGLRHKADPLTIMLVQVSVLCPIGCDQCVCKTTETRLGAPALLMLGYDRNSGRAVKTDRQLSESQPIK